LLIFIIHIAASFQIIFIQIRLQILITDKILFIFRLKKGEKITKERQRFVKEQLLQQELKVQKQREKAHKTVQRLKLLKLLKEEERRLKNVKRKEHAEKIRQRCKIAQHRVINVKVKWKIKNKVRKKARNKRLMDIKQQNRKVMEERYELFTMSL
jgi:hypothetical protein